MIIDNYGTFDFSTYDMTVLAGTIDGDEITGLHTGAAGSGEELFCIYTPMPACNQLAGDASTVCGMGNVAAYGYEWKKTDMKMTSLEGD
jgi:hypothetical protein